MGDAKEKVCVDAFKSLYGIKISRIRRLRSLLGLGKSPKDRRGKKLGTNAIRGNVTSTQITVEAKTKTMH